MGFIANARWGEAAAESAAVVAYGGLYGGLVTNQHWMG